MRPLGVPLGRPLRHIDLALRSRRGGSRIARLGKLLSGRRALLFAPPFAVSLALLAHAPPADPRALAPIAALAAAAYALRIWATGYRTWWRGERRSRHLMRAGPYAHVRHPVYVANVLAGAAWFAIVGDAALFLGFLVLAALVHVPIVAREEETLAERYGELYARYRARVPAFVPLAGRSLGLEDREGGFSWEPVRAGLEPFKAAGYVGLVAGAFVVRTV